MPLSHLLQDAFVQIQARLPVLWGEGVAPSCCSQPNSPCWPGRGRCQAAPPGEGSQPPARLIKLASENGWIGR